MKYFYAILAFSFGISLLMSGAFAEQKTTVSSRAQAQQRQSESKTCVQQKKKLKDARDCQSRRVGPGQ